MKPASDKPFTPIVVPIRSLGPAHRARIAEHLLSLDARDRYLRFGYVATDDQVQRYTAGIDFDRDEIFGIYNRRLELIAVAHLAFASDSAFPGCAEFGVSVVAKARGRGYGSRLFERAVMHARNEGVELLFVHALSENAAMLKIARKAGAALQREGSETEAYLRVPPATLDSRLGELFDEQLAQTDYQLKRQARNFWNFLAGVQEVRQGVREARHKSGV
ncbi:GNAT family N-acetyltransferase [Ramlibacter sp. AW1]|uniref:GNAT family N-acetyltransferase n=1 Tax=Ramlibacter aurantiacus TaxID=2801330 RepID=A0A937D795_9BURK|nr:GNAT family N-acetyltransferase [Ramlibacter aurantiacus]MBL0421778.1 GNAT family N-acetyltransferase [Ramlibacter aurantiacus]